jgi:DNA-binding winged helix-turn-helix (wHTH) protein
MTVFTFGDFEADDSKFELRRCGQTLRVQRIVLETIFFLVKSRGRAVSKADLLRGPWKGHKVGDAAVSRAVMLARRALDDSSGYWIATVHGVGYRFMAPVVESALPPAVYGRNANTVRSQDALVVDMDELQSSPSNTTRTFELTMLQRALAKSREGRGRLVLVKGGPGAGKTTLVEHFAKQCSAGGTLVAWGRAWSSASPLWHWLEVSRSCRALLERLTPEASDTLRRWAVLVDELERFSKSPSEHQGLLSVFDAVTHSLDQLSRALPLVVVLEGLQDADEFSLGLLEFLRQRLGQMPLLIIATSRPDRRARAGLIPIDERAPHVHVMDLPPG